MQSRSPLRHGMAPDGHPLECLPACAEPYRNPVISGMNPDPSVVRVDRDYFLTTSTFEYFPGCAIYHSLDLVHWQPIGHALNRPGQFKALRSEHPALYACTLRYHAGTYYLLTTDVNGGGNFFVTASDPSGPWSDPILIDQGMFDPSFFFDEDGKVYYTRRGPGDGENIVQAEIDIRTGKLLTQLRTVSTGFDTNDAEGPHLYKIDGWYYLSEAEGSTRALHQQTVGRSHSPWGPFTPDPDNPWAVQRTDWGYPIHGVGHCDLVDTPEGDWWTVCLGTRGAFSLGRETFLFRVHWRQGWPTLNPQDMKSLTVLDGPANQAPEVPEPGQGDFSQPKLGLAWNTIGPLGAANYSLRARRGYLRLYGQPDARSFWKSTSFVGRRQTEANTISTVTMEFEPEGAGETAGLTVFMSPNYYYAIAKVRKAEGVYLQLIKQVSDIRTVAAEVSVGSGPLRLRFESEAQQYQFSYATSSGNWAVLGAGDAHLISSEVANVWSGAYIGMFCVSPALPRPRLASAEGAQTSGPTSADFEFFEYRATP